MLPASCNHAPCSRRQVPACLLGTRCTRRSNRAHRLWYGPVQFDARAAFLTVYRELICFEEYHRHLLLRAAIWDDIAPCAWFFAHAWDAAELQAERSKSTHARGAALPGNTQRCKYGITPCRVRQNWSYRHRPAPECSKSGVIRIERCKYGVIGLRGWP